MIDEMPQQQPEAIDGHEPPFFTVKVKTAFIKGLTSRPGLTLYLGTFNGPKKVGSIGADYTIHCPEDNGGLGKSYAGHPEKTLYLIPDDSGA